MNFEQQDMCYFLFLMYFFFFGMIYCKTEGIVGFGHGCEIAMYASLGIGLIYLWVNWDEITGYLGRKYKY